MSAFGETTDPRLYVPRDATERALAALRDNLAGKRGVAVVTGPPGIGKTMLLRVLQSQLARVRCAFLPYAALETEDLARVALDAVGEDPAVPLALDALRSAVVEGPGEGLVLLVDDAGALPVASARALRALVDATDRRLQVVAAFVDDARAARLIAALGTDVPEIRLRDALTLAEVHAYVRGRTRRAGTSGDALRDEQVEWLAAESGGIPRVIHALAAALLSPARAGIPEAALAAVEEHGSDDDTAGPN